MGENITDYSNKRPIGGLNVDYFLEHAEEIINDTEHLSNPYDFGVLRIDDDSLVRHYYHELEKTHRSMWMAFGRNNSFMNPGETSYSKALDRVTREYCEATGHWDMYNWIDIKDHPYPEEEKFNY